MKFSIALASCLAGLTSAIAIPAGTGGASIQVPSSNELRIFYQDVNSKIYEASVGLPTNTVSNTDVIFTGPTRKNTPLASLTWAESAGIHIRTYFITASNTLGEVGFDINQWNSGGDLGIPVQANSQLLYANIVNNYLIVGYTNPLGQLSEAYYYRGGSGGWQTYVL